MPLIDLKTDLKSLKYGSDRQGGGDSGLPYIKTDINTVDRDINRFRLTKFDDGLIRGGLVGATNASIVDTLRIGKFLTDFSKGPLFIVKQVGLQLSNPRLEVPKNPANIASGGLDNILTVGTNGLLEPTRIYNLGINTIAQIPITALGGHINRHGILPVQTKASKYEAVVTANNDLLGSSKFNRLVGLTNKFKLGDRTSNLTIDKRINNTINTIFQIFSTVTGIPTSPIKINPQDLIIDDYAAGPGSVYGIGRTTINRYSNTEDGFKINSSLSFSKQYAGYTRTEAGKISFNSEKVIGKGNESISEYPNIPLPIIPKNVYGNIKTYSNIAKINNTAKTNIATTYAVFERLIGSPTSSEVNQFHIIATGSNGKPLMVSGSIAYSSNKIQGDKIRYINGYGDVVTVNYNNWSEASREKRIGSGRKDSINLTPIFKEGSYWYGDNKNHNIRDLVKFAIQAIDTNNPSKSDFMIFRAYLTQFSDSVDSQWTDVKYIGRGNPFHIYNGFTRKISIGFKVAALSVKEMQPMYSKLNYLMSNLMPDYEGVLMRGPLVRMTVGNYLDAQLGKLDSISYNIPNDSPWEIAIDEPEGGTKVLILPHIIEVTMNFTPIGAETGINTNNTGSAYNKIEQKSKNTSLLAQNTTGTDVATIQYYDSFFNKK